MSGGPGTAMGISVDLVTTDQQAPIGFIHTVPASKGTGGSGEQEWVYIQADPAGSDLLEGQMVSFGSAPATVDLPGGAIHPFGIFGVAQHTILAGKYGFILKSGLGSILANTDLSDKNGFICAVAGGGATVATSPESAAVGLALDDITGGTVGPAFIKL